MNTNSLIKRVQKSTFGKAICRLVGEESGQAMMEYVLIAVLIAAACAVALWYFGRSVSNETRVASHGVTGDISEAQRVQAKAQQNVVKQDQAAQIPQKALINTKDESKADIE